MTMITRLKLRDLNHHLSVLRISRLRFSDFFGIDHVTNKDVAGYDHNKRTTNLNEKFRPLLVSRKCEEKEEVKIPAIFGAVRRDMDNVVSKHGQYDESNNEPLYKFQDIRRLYMNEDEQKDCNSEEQQEDVENVRIEFESSVIMSKVPAEEDLDSIMSRLQSSNSCSIDRIETRKPLEFEFVNACITKHTEHQQIHFEPRLIVDEPDLNHVEPQSNLRSFRPNLDKYPDIDEEDQNSKAFDDEIMAYEPFDKKVENQVNEGIREGNEPRSAFEYLQSLKTGRSKPTSKFFADKVLKSDDEIESLIRKKEKLDSKGFRDLGVQVPDFTKLRRVELVDYLKKSIIYDNYDIVAINKPYGIACHGGKQRQEGPHLQLDSLLDDFAKLIKSEKLFLVHRLDKNTTGVLLMARTRERAQFMQRSLESGEMTKIYHCITKDVPYPPEGVIDIPIDEFTVDGKVRRCLRPEPIERMRQLTKSKDLSKRAITEYKVLNTSGSTALVEVRPKTGVRHQIRCHLGFGLRTPILGDHTYSHLSRVAPQKLPMDILMLLKVRQAKVRNIPLHLHASRVVIPYAKQGENLFIRAPMPFHFVKNLRTLKLDKGIADTLPIVKKTQVRVMNE